MLKFVETISMNEIILLVEEDDEAGYIAKALGEPIITEADTIEELRIMVKDAVQCHFEDAADRHTRIVSTLPTVF